MELCLLVTSEMSPIPSGINIIQDFGTESIIPEGQGSADALTNKKMGYSMLLSGEKDDFVNWLKAFDGIWTTDSPGCGNWYVVHIKPDLAGER